MTHECTNEGKISTLMTKVEHLEGNDSKIENSLEKINDKVDKILWFILGQSVTLLVTVIGGLALYALVS